MNIIATIVLLHCLINILFKRVNAVICFDCRADDNTCNIGECQGAICVKMETSNIDNGRKMVYKSCSDEYEDTECKQSGFGKKIISRCVCQINFCNGDKHLEMELQQSNGINNKKLCSLPLILGLILICISQIYAFIVR